MNSLDQMAQLEALRSKLKSRNFDLSSSKSDAILENETPVVRMETPKEENYNKYGDAASEVEIEAVGARGDCIRAPFSAIPDGGVIDR